MIITREILEEKEHINLRAYAIKNSGSKGRKYYQEKDPYRLDFQRDRDRVIHSMAFRRLKDKTQVFVSHYGDHYRNRLSHTLEVAGFSRDLARNLGVNEDLAETIALAHDLGHTPFGHAGEEKLDTIMRKFRLRFEHNEQSKRIVSILEKRYPDFPGLNLSYEVLDGISKHSTSYDQMDTDIKYGLSIEAGIVNICDEITYLSHDVDDAIRSGVLSISEFACMDIFKESNMGTVYEQYMGDEKYFIRCINNVTKMMMQDCYKQTLSNINQLGIKTVEDVYNTKQSIVSLSKEMEDLVTPLRDVLYNKFYFSDKVRKQSKRGQKIVEFLFNLYISHPTSEMESSSEPLHIVVKDYIAGMTDAFALKIFND